MSSGWLGRMLLAAKEYKPGNIKLGQAVDALGLVKPAPIDKETIEVAKDVQSGSSRLEKIVNKRAPFISFDKYINELSAIGRRIARVEIPAGTEAGTGWLVGPDLLLTAYHVVEDIVDSVNGQDRHDLSFNFDYRKADGSSRLCGVKENWLLDGSSYSEHDLAATGSDPEANKLDYALIQLAESVGEDIINGAKRGWIEIPEHPIAMSNEDYVVIPQHPDGRPLELAFGKVFKYNKAANRVQYDTNTEHGSSGSPCFDVSLQPFALHHASGPKDNLNYNQGVPLREIIKLMKLNNVTPFWKKMN
jgi:V8-like Glu-specific endopeptidase